MGTSLKYILLIWTLFILCRNPNSEKTTFWPKYTTSSPSYLELRKPGEFVSGQNLLGDYCALWSEIADAAEAKTSKGLIKGKLVDYSDGRKVYEYLGIPFAKPPVGDLRYKDPQPAASFPGEFSQKNIVTIDSRILSNLVFVESYFSCLVSERAPANVNSSITICPPVINPYAADG